MSIRVGLIVLLMAAAVGCSQQTYPLSPTEVVALRELEEARLSLAPVVSGNPGASAIIEKAFRIGQGEAILAREAERRLGCAVVRSGATWQRM